MFIINQINLLQNYKKQLVKEGQYQKILLLLSLILFLLSGLIDNVTELYIPNNNSKRIEVDKTDDEKKEAKVELKVDIKMEVQGEIKVDAKKNVKLEVKKEIKQEAVKPKKGNEGKERV